MPIRSFYLSILIGAFLLAVLLLTFSLLPFVMVYFAVVPVVALLVGLTFWGGTLLLGGQVRGRPLRATQAFWGGFALVCIAIGIAVLITHLLH